jgi:hypothetical protein
VSKRAGRDARARMCRPWYIPRLVARVVTLSVETVRLVSELTQAVSLESVIPPSLLSGMTGEG